MRFISFSWAQLTLRLVSAWVCWHEHFSHFTTAPVIRIKLNLLTTLTKLHIPKQRKIISFFYRISFNRTIKKKCVFPPFLSPYDVFFLVLEVSLSSLLHNSSGFSSKCGTLSPNHFCGSIHHSTECLFFCFSLSLIHTITHVPHLTASFDALAKCYTKCEIILTLSRCHTIQL